MGMGYIARSATDGDNLVGDAGTRGYAKRARLVRVWAAMGIRVHDQSVAGQPVAAASRLGRVSCVEKRTIAPESPGAGMRNRGAVLRALDRAKLFGVPPIHSAAFELAF